MVENPKTTPIMSPNAFQGSVPLKKKNKKKRMEDVIRYMIYI